MSRVLVVLVVALALAGALLWFTTASRTPRGARPELQAAAATDRSAAAPTALTPVVAQETPSVPHAEPPAAPAAPAASRREATGAHADELARAQWIDGRVLFPPGTPADEELFVTAEGRDFSDGSDHRVPVARDGTFRVAFSEKTRSGRFELDAHYLYLGEIVRWKREESSGPVVLEPKLGGRITGRLRVPAGTEPRSVGGKVELSVQVDMGDHSSTDGIATHDVTDELVFAFDALVPGASAQRTYAIDYDGGRFIGRSGTLVPEAGQTLAVELALRPGLTLSGVVRDTEGRPLAGVELDANSMVRSGAWTNANHRDGKSAADGTFRLGALAPGKLRLQAELTGFQRLERELDEPAEGAAPAELELVLDRGSAIAGIVRWPDGTPAEATLEFAALGETRFGVLDYAKTCKSDAEGRFSLSGLRTEPYRVTARAMKAEEVKVTSEITGRERTKKEHHAWIAEAARVSPGTSDLVLTLSAGLALDGRVFDERGAALADFHIEATHKASESSFDPQADLSKSYHDTDGSFRMEGLAPGEWKLVASSRGFVDSEPLRITVPTAEPVVLALTHEAVVSGRVVDPSGAPVPGASVGASAMRGRTSFALRDGDGAEATADENGAFELHGLSAGTVQLQASSSGFAPSEPVPAEVTAGATIPGVVLTLRQGATILGDVVDSEGHPEVSLSVWCTGQSFSGNAETDTDGRFELTGVAPGELSIRTQTNEGLHLEETVSVAAGDTARVHLAPPSTVVHVHGKVRAGGEPLAGARLSGFLIRGEGEVQGGSATADTSEDGSYELVLPGAGTYSLNVVRWKEGSTNWSTTLEVPALESFAYDVSIAFGRISGRVTDSEGKALVGIVVASEPEQHEDEGHGSSQAQTDGEGNYELLVPVGRHAVTAGGGNRWWRANEGPPYAEARVGGLVVTDNAHLRGIDLRLAAGGILEGVVRFADGSAARSAWLFSEHGGALERLGLSDPYGHFRINGMSVGSHLVSAQSFGDGGGATREPVPVQIVAGETKQLELTLAAATRVHLSVRQNGAPVGSEIQVVDEHGRRQVVQSGRSGDAWLGPLVPGRYTITAQRDGKKAEKVLEILAGGGKELESELVFE